jgi:hypothetical protein
MAKYPLDPLYLAYAKEAGIPVQIMTGFSGFPAAAPGSPPTVVDTPALLVNGAISLTAEVDDTLTCTMGNWNGEPTGYLYEWKRDGETDVGVDDPAYVVITADVGHSITCVVTATNAAGSTEAPPSNAVAVNGAERSTRRIPYG